MEVEEYIMRILDDEGSKDKFEIIKDIRGTTGITPSDVNTVIIRMKREGKIVEKDYIISHGKEY